MVKDLVYFCIFLQNVFQESGSMHLWGFFLEWRSHGELCVNPFLLLNSLLPLEKKKKTPEEMDEEKRYVEAWMEAMGVDGVVIEWDPEPYRYMISQILRIPTLKKELANLLLRS